jgi:hypothetical protein
MKAPVTDAPRVQALLEDPATSFWLKSTLMAALERDPVDALNDALVLAEVLDVELRARLGLDEVARAPPDIPLPEHPETLIEDDALPG